jgi:hypothetical protein
MPTLREELEPLRRLVKGGNYGALKAMIEFIDAADKALRYVSENIDCEPEWEVAKIAEKARALLDQQIE